jgi:NADPH:quinone reductase-like Zn-dependent oxidoreductase
MQFGRMRSLTRNFRILWTAAAKSKKIAVTGAAGAVGSFIVQLAALASLHVVAVSSSKGRDEEFLTSLGAAKCSSMEI